MGTETTIKVEQKAEPKNKVKFDVSFDDVIGQETAKRKVKIVEKFLQDPEKFGRWAPRNILFYGVSGTGKTMIAKALSAEAGVPMLAVKSTSLIGEFVGEGARQIHNLYEKAEEMAPCIIFIDELDAIALDRRYQDLRGDVSEIVNSLLTEMDGISNRLGVCTIAATNQIAVLDASVRSRFEEEIEFTLPNLDERFRLLEKDSATLPLELENVDLREIARQTEGFSGRDLVEKVLKAALHHAIMEESNITQRHLEETIPKARKEYRQPPKRCSPKRKPFCTFRLINFRLAMWQDILNKFKRFPAQEKVIRLILQRGFQINDEARVVSGQIEIPHAQIAKELDVDRRVVDTTAQAIRRMKPSGRSSRMFVPLLFWVMWHRSWAWASLRLRL